MKRKTLYSRESDGGFGAAGGGGASPGRGSAGQHGRSSPRPPALISASSAAAADGAGHEVLGWKGVVQPAVGAVLPAILHFAFLELIIVERALFYGAGTRAKKSVLVTSSGTPSPFLSVPN